MATFKTCIRKMRSDGYFPVYIRVTQDRKAEYLKTNLIVFYKDVKKGEIKDPYVIVEGASRIKHYINTLNQQNTESWSAKEIVDFLQYEGKDLSFTDYTNKYIAKLINADRGQCAKGYVAALKALQRYFGTEDIKFHQLTHVSIQGYIESLAHTATAKSKYPCCIKTVFKVACDEFNDYDRNIIKIKTQPFIKIRIPDKEVAEKRALEIAAIKKFFSWELPETRMALPLQELGRDVCLMSFCLAGINSVDLYKMQKSCLRDDWTLCYNRSKVMSRRDDKAYMEIKVPSLIRPLLEKYKDKDKNSVKLFNFHKRFASSDSFNADVNCGIKTVCKIAEIKPFSYYAFRHSWATIANNDLDASIEMIAFCLNHQSAHKVAWRYTKKDFTKIDKLNDQVLKYVFG